MAMRRKHVAIDLGVDPRAVRELVEVQLCPLRRVENKGGKLIDYVVSNLAEYRNWKELNGYSRSEMAGLVTD
jgi:hypothetical protein